MHFLRLCRYGRWKGRSIGRILCATLVWIIHEVCATLLGHTWDEVLGSSGSSVRPASLQDRCATFRLYSSTCRVPRSWGWICLEARIADLIVRAVCMCTSLFWGLQVPFLPFGQEPHAFIHTTLWVRVVSASSHLFWLLSLSLFVPWLGRGC